MSRIRTALAAIGATAVAATGLVLTASPAQANTVAVVTIDYEPNSTGCFSEPPTVRGNPGQTFTIHYVDSQNCTDSVTTQLIGNLTASPASISRGGTMTVTLGAVGTGEVVIVGPNLSGGVKVTIVDPAVEVIPTLKAHDYFQGVGVPSSGNCADVHPSVGHFRGYPIGGWSKSWAWWINDGKGGPVCVREVEERPDGTIVLIG